MSDEHALTLRQADQARADFCAIESELEVIQAQLARIPNARLPLSHRVDGDGEHLGAFQRGRAAVDAVKKWHQR